MISIDYFRPITDGDIKEARKADLPSVLDRYHPDKITDNGYNLALTDDPNIEIVGSNYFNNLTADSGNAIDFFVNFLGYPFPDAVRTLIGRGSVYSTV